MKVGTRRVLRQSCKVIQQIGGDHARPLPFREKTLPQKAFRHFVLKLLLLINAEPIVDKLPCWTFKPSKHQM